VQNRPIHDYGYDFLSLEFAYAGNMRKKYATYKRHMPNSAYFPAYFASKSSAYFEKILCYQSASLTETACRRQMSLNEEPNKAMKAILQQNTRNKQEIYIITIHNPYK